MSVPAKGRVDIVLRSGVGAMIFREQADKCRAQANEFAGKPEAPFLLRVASAFDELATEADTRLIVHSGHPVPSAPALNA